MRTLPTDALAVSKGCYIDDTEAKRIKLFAKKYCGVDFIPWQYEDFIEPLFSWRRAKEPDESIGKLRAKVAHLWLPKKSGKSFALAVLATWKCTGKEKTKTIVMSGVKEQCDEIWECIENFTMQNATLKARLWLRKTIGIIQDRVTGSTIKIISGKGDAKSGFNCNLLIIDEFFEMHPAYANKTWDKVKDSGMARANSLVITISHANYNHTGPAYEAWQKTQKILDNKTEDWTTYVLKYGVPEYADWKDENNWWPNLPGCPHIVSKDWYREEYEKVKDSPVLSVAFRTLHLNQITSVTVNWLAPSQISQCEEKVLTPSCMFGTEVIIGIDAAKSYDIYVYSIVSKIGDLYYVLPKFFIPEKKAAEWEKKHHVPYTRWANDPSCSLTCTPGDCIDHLFVVEKIKQEAKAYRVKEVRYDPTNFESSRQMIFHAGIPVKQVTQNQKHMGPAFKFLETLFTTQKIRHWANPIWLNHLDNCVPKIDRYDKLNIVKAQDITKIDGVDATAIALSYWIDEETTAQVLPPGQSYVMVF